MFPMIHSSPWDISARIKQLCVAGGEKRCSQQGWTSLFGSHEHLDFSGRSADLTSAAYKAVVTRSLSCHKKGGKSIHSHECKPMPADEPSRKWRSQVLNGLYASWTGHFRRFDWHSDATDVYAHNFRPRFNQFLPKNPRGNIFSGLTSKNSKAGIWQQPEWWNPSSWGVKHQKKSIVERASSNGICSLQLEVCHKG